MNTKFIKLIVLLFITSIQLNAQQATEVNSTKVVQMLKSDSKLILLDVRTPDEFSSGHIKGAINIDVRQPDALNKIEKLDRNAKYIVYCRTNNRSGYIINSMVKSGFKTVYQMTDGITGWNQNGLPVNK